MMRCSMTKSGFEPQRCVYWRKACSGETRSKSGNARSVSTEAKNLVMNVRVKRSTFVTLARSNAFLCCFPTKCSSPWLCRAVRTMGKGTELHPVRQSGQTHAIAIEGRMRRAPGLCLFNSARTQKALAIFGDLEDLHSARTHTHTCTHAHMHTRTHNKLDPGAREQFKSSSP